MSNILLEAGFPTVDIRSFFNGVNNEPEEGNGQASSEATQNGASTENATGSQEETSQLQKNSTGDWKLQLLEIKDTKGAPVFSLEVIEKLRSLGRPFIKALEILGYSIKLEDNGNSILAFMAQKWVQEKLLMPGLLNASTFGAIYNAVAKRLVVDSEFFKENDYNIIYCPDLYKKSAKEMQEYLELQREILPVAKESYSDKDKIENKKVFLVTKTISELLPERRASLINKEVKEYGLPDDIKTVKNATLNSIKVASLIKNGATETPTVGISTKQQDELLKKLITNSSEDTARIYAALLALSLSTNNKQAAAALNDNIFNGLTLDKVREATKWLAMNRVLPKGQINDTDASSLVARLIASRSASSSEK